MILLKEIPKYTFADCYYFNDLGVWTTSSISSGIWIYSSDMTLKASKASDNGKFSLSCELNVGETYIIKVGDYKTSNVRYISVQVDISRIEGVILQKQRKLLMVLILQETNNHLQFILNMI